MCSTTLNGSLDSLTTKHDLKGLTKLLLATGATKLPAAADRLEIRKPGTHLLHICHTLLASEDR
jgi:hypothetical protein